MSVDLGGSTQSADQSITVVSRHAREIKLVWRLFHVHICAMWQFIETVKIYFLYYFSMANILAKYLMTLPDTNKMKQYNYGREG